jgi:hypothetical protein
VTTPGGLSWQGGWDEPGVLSVVIVESGQPGTGIFLYSGVPSAGNPPVGWMTTSTTDPFGTTVQPGIFLAEVAASGNAKGGLLWNTIVGSEPLLALYPDATVGFTGNSPFVLGRVFNRGAANELLALALGGGGTAGTGSPPQIELFSQSKDGTVLGHVSFFDWATTDLLIDINAGTLVTAADPVTVNTLETWHAMPAFNTHFSHGSPAPAFKLYPDDTVSFAGEVTVASGTTSGTVVTLPNAPYFPASVKKFPVAISAGTPAGAANVQVTVDTSGNIILSAGPTGAGYNFVLDGIRYPLDY